MTDRYGDHSANLTSPAAGAFSITPSDATILAEVTRAVYVGGSGTLQVETAWGQVVTFQSVPTGSLLPLRVKRVLAASTATAILGLY